MEQVGLGAMEPLLERVYLEELQRQCRWALFAAARIERCWGNGEPREALFYELQAFFYHVAAASRILWPPRARRESARRRAQKRGAHLRRHLEMPVDHLLVCRALRRRLERDDERLDAWVCEGSHHVAVGIAGSADSDSGPDMSGKDVLRQFDPAAECYVLGGETFDVRAYVNGLLDLSSRIESRLRHLSEV